MSNVFHNETLSYQLTQYFVLLGPYYPLGTTGTVPRAYNMFRAYEGKEGIKIK
jgi:hypothetical protein